jgi:mannose-6-phosphate isomerase-like protein (cupin superfamily)
MRRPSFPRAKRDRRAAARLRGPDHSARSRSQSAVSAAVALVRRSGESWPPPNVSRHPLFAISLRESHRIAAVPFTFRNLREDLEDLGSNFDGAPDLEFRMASRALGLEECGLSYQRIPPDYRFPFGHTHKRQEEVYVVAGGSGRMKLDDEIVEVKKWDVVRVPPGTWRGYEAGPEGLEILVFGAPSLGDNPREDVEGQRDWWAD